MSDENEVEFETEEEQEEGQEEESTEETEEEDDTPSHEIDADDIFAEMDAELDDDEKLEVKEEEEESEEVTEEELDKALEEEPEEEEEENPKLSLLEIMDKEAKIDEEEEPEFSDDVTDDDIVTAMHMTPTYKAWMDSAKEEGVEISDRMKSLAAREGVDPKKLGKHGVYSLNDALDKLDTISEKVDEDAVYAPKEDDVEGNKQFLHERYGMALEKEDFVDAVFKGTYLEDADEKTIDDLKEWGLEGGYSPAQLNHIVQKFESAQEEMHKEIQAEEEVFIRDQIEQLKNMYGEDFNDIYRTSKKELMTKGREFFEKYQDSKALHSKEFWVFLNNMVNSGMKLGQYKFDQVTKSLREAPLEKLEEYRDKIMKHKHYNNQAKNSDNPKIRAYHKGLRKRLHLITRYIEEKS